MSLFTLIHILICSTSSHAQEGYSISPDDVIALLAQNMDDPYAVQALIEDAGGIDVVREAAVSVYGANDLGGEVYYDGEMASCDEYGSTSADIPEECPDLNRCTYDRCDQDMSSCEDPTGELYQCYMCFYYRDYELGCISYNAQMELMDIDSQLWEVEEQIHWWRFIEKQPLKDDKAELAQTVDALAADIAIIEAEAAEATRDYNYATNEYEHLTIILQSDELVNVMAPKEEWSNYDAEYNYDPETEVQMSIDDDYSAYDPDAAVQAYGGVTSGSYDPYADLYDPYDQGSEVDVWGNSVEDGHSSVW